MPTCTYMHKHANTSTYICTFKHTHTNHMQQTHTYIHTSTHTHTHKYIQTHKHTHALTYIYTHMHTQTHRKTHERRMETSQEEGLQRGRENKGRKSVVETKIHYIHI